MKPHVLREKGLFVTGTDTGVGKTLVAAGIANLLRSTGIDVGVMKPVATGGKRLSDKLVSEDAMLMMEAARSKDGYSLVNPVCLPSLMAPIVASKVDHLHVEWETIWSAYKTLEKRHKHLIVEGIGGLLVPITDRLHVADMARRMKLPVLIVSRPTLGTINHTLLTIEAARKRRLRIKGVIFNSTRMSSGTLMTDTNKAEIERHSGVPVIATIPYMGTPTPGSIASFLGHSIKLQEIL
ncbi:MAG: dethiobiotin synthase [Candidatus Brocadiales bacterium]